MGLKELHEFEDKMRQLREGKPDWEPDKRPDPWSAHRAKKKDTDQKKKMDKRIM
jgi:hypothetical protein